MTPIEIGAAIQAGKAAFETIRSLADVVNKAENKAEALQITTAIAELGARLTELQVALLDLTRENEELRQKLDADANLERFKGRYRYEETVSWKCEDSGNRIDGPFCPNCIDEGKERRLNPGGTRGYYSCVVHGSSFKTDPHAPPRFGAHSGFMR